MESPNRYDSSIDTIFAEAWTKTTGMKALFWKAVASIILAIVIVTNLGFTLSGFFLTDNVVPPLITPLIHLMINIFFLMPLLTGLLMICVRNCTGENAPINTLFHYFHYWKRLWIYPVAFTGFAFLEYLLTGFDMIQLVLFLIFMICAIIYFMHIPLMIDKNYSLTAALQLSRKTITHNKWQVMGFLLSIMIILSISSLTLGFVLIWTIPWIGNAIAIFYRELFGIQISLIN
jgi:uncharacterized membrane protein